MDGQAGPPRVAVDVEVIGAAPRTAASSMTLRQELFRDLFVESPADVLRAVPGLVIAQHAGGGKADQYLVRGFDADHGTDVALAVDGVPVNLVSHAHGQGYADLHFLIPETVERIDLYKGPYFAEFGNLATAAAVQVRTRDFFDRSFVRVDGGSFDTGRIVFGLSPAGGDGRRFTGFLAGEARFTNGPFLNDQNFRRLNLAGRWRGRLTEAQTLAVTALGYDGRWNASGQVPARLVDSGELDPFGAVDPTEGGDTFKYQAAAQYALRRGAFSVLAQGYAMRYSMDLFSNFTFYEVDPERGDGIEQRDDRVGAGGHVQTIVPHRIAGLQAVFTGGLDLRRDAVDVGLLRQQERVTFDTIVDSTIAEGNAGAYVQEEMLVGTRLRALVGLRHDRFRFDVVNRAAADGPGGVRSDSWFGPKASLIGTLLDDRSLSLFANYGRGFHSNDARAAVSSPTAEILPSALGWEVGVRKQIGHRAEVSAAWWHLDLEQEFTWVGDEGTTELSGATRRRGLEVEGRWQVATGLWLEADATRSTGHYRDTGEAIARAPRFTMNASVVLTDRKGWGGQLRVRHVGDHPANESATATSLGFTAADLTVRRRLSSNWTLLATLDNMFNQEFREAQTWFASRLANEAEAVEDIHFTPGNPRALRVGLQYTFGLQ